MSFINRSHVTDAPIKTIRWDVQFGAFVYSKRIDNGWGNAPIEQPFAMDVYQIMHGFEQWVSSGGSRERSVVLAPADKPLPTKPEGKATAIYSVPVYSAEIGGRSDLIVNGTGPTEALDELFSDVQEMLHGLDEKVLPVITVSTDCEGLFGAKPTFAITDWTRRPEKFGRPLVTF